jgi:hypothetical protein
MACREVLFIVVNSSRDALFCLVGLTRVLPKTSRLSSSSFKFHASLQPLFTIVFEISYTLTHMRLLLENDSKVR